MQNDAGAAVPGLPIGLRVGDYVVRESVAAGGFGSVYRVEHVTLGTHAALKVLHRELAATPEAVLRFEREVDVVSKLHHPNVVEIFDSGRLDDGRPYFVMELLIGVDLDTHIRAKRRLPPSDIEAILEALCSALSLAHERGIIHRDLKASNVFLSSKDGKRRVVLLDFGVAKILDEQGPGLTAPQHSVGTPFCMAPEQIRGGQALDARTDVYALGALSYYMLTGELPFYDPSVQHLQYMLLFMRPKKPSAVAQVGTAFDEVILRALSKEPIARPSSVMQFLEEFRAVAAGGSVDVGKQYDRRMMAIYVNVRATPDAMEAYEDGDEDLCDDLEKCLPLAQQVLGKKGYLLASATGNARLYMKELLGDGERDEASRREAVRAVSELESELAKRATFDPRVMIDICLHVGMAEIVGGKIAGGELLQMSWVPQREWSGVVASGLVFEGLGLKTQESTEVPGYFKLLQGAA